METIEEFLLSAEYILHHWNDQVVLCEGGICTFETSTRNTLDMSPDEFTKLIGDLRNVSRIVGRDLL